MLQKADPDLPKVYQPGDPRCLTFDLRLLSHIDSLVITLEFMDREKISCSSTPLKNGNKILVIREK